MTDSHDYHDEAIGPLAEAGAIKSCAIHSDVWINQGDPDAEKLAYAIFVNRLKADGFDGSDASSMTSAVQAALVGSADDECPVCASS